MVERLDADDRQHRWQHGSLDRADALGDDSFRCGLAFVEQVLQEWRVAEMRDDLHAVSRAELELGVAVDIGPEADSNPIRAGSHRLVQLVGLAPVVVRRIEAIELDD